MKFENFGDFGVGFLLACFMFMLLWILLYVV